MRTNGVGYSPRMWGWTVVLLVDLVHPDVFPTHVGVDPRLRAPSCAPRGIPHACGGGPLTGLDGWSKASYSPRMWGWTPAADTALVVEGVFPTHVGVDPEAEHQFAVLTSIPHACGGGPTYPACAMRSWRYSPRMWGWTREGKIYTVFQAVFPTHVGVDPGWPRASIAIVCIPHACGGGPVVAGGTPAVQEYSPRMWGWTLGIPGTFIQYFVFPTHVGVDLAGPVGPAERTCIPHACGGGPHRRARRSPRRPYSPRMWGWTRRGGVGGAPAAYSPRMWGWTQRRHGGGRGEAVFPTHVGVDPPPRRCRGWSTCIPHACGGGPDVVLSACATSSYSPRMWGWTRVGAGRPAALGVFPTHVGVDRWRPSAITRSPCIPHACGGGPVVLAGGGEIQLYSPRMWGWTWHTAR